MKLFARFLPWVITWLTVLMSARVWDWLPPNVEIDAAQAIFTFGGGPLVAFAFALTGRRAEQKAGTQLGLGTSLTLSWVIAFIAALHALGLGQAIGKVGSLVAYAPLATAILFLGLGPLLAIIEPGSPMGIRTRRTLGDAPRWRKTHVVLGVLFAIAGGLGIAATAIGLEIPLAVGASVIPGVLGLLAAIVYGSR